CGADDTRRAPESRSSRRQPAATTGGGGLRSEGKRDTLNGRHGSSFRPDKDLPMPARVLVSLVLIAVVAGGLTVLAAQIFNLPFALLGLFAALAALAFRLWIDKR
ncbi:MAG: hypothetical protein U1D35_11955, partial [Paracoccaceae bacterium]|nr:hypothetical protein [Paracoccaceae bacterium]